MRITSKRNTVEEWRTDFGDAYIERNEVSETNIQIRLRAIAKVLDHLGGAPPKSISAL